MRRTSKGIPFINHRVLGKCAVLVKEKVNGKYGLLGGGIEKKEGEEDALERELREEIGGNHKISKTKELVTIETDKQIHNVFALKMKGDFIPARNEISGFAFYPLEDKYYKEREAIRKNMEYYAKVALKNLRRKHNWQNYDVSDLRIEGKYFDQFHRELDDLKKKIQNKK